MLEYLKTKVGFLPQLLKHLGTSAIMDLVLKLVTCVENKNSRLEIAQVGFNFNLKNKSFY